MYPTAAKGVTIVSIRGGRDEVEVQREGESRRVELTEGGEGGKGRGG